MSASDALTSTGHSLEYVLLIEGIGWLTNERNGLSGKFDGDVFVTADLNGDLESLLGDAATSNLLTSNQATGGDALGDTTGFTALEGAVISASTDFAWQGTRSIKVVTDGVDADFEGVVVAAILAPSAASLVGSMYVYSAAGTTVRARVRNTTAGTNGATTTAVIPAGVWTRIADLPAPAFSAGDSIAMRVFEDTAASAVTFYVDGAQIEVGTTSTAWVDGVRQGLTIHKGLMLPASIEDKIDPMTLVHEPGGLNLDIVDDGFMLENMSPHRTPDETTVSTTLDYSSTTVVLADGTDFAERAKCLLGGRELVLLGVKSGSGPHTYTRCTRGHLGTPRGRVDTKMPDDDNMAWSAATVAQSTMQFLYNRRVRLYAHVPGEATTGMMLMFSGKLRGMSSDAQGTQWRLEATGETVTPVSRTYYPASNWLAEQKGLWASSNQKTAASHHANSTGVSLTEYYEKNIMGEQIYLELRRATSDAQQLQDKYAVAQLYQYRTEPGGTAGIKADIDAAINNPATTDTPQAPTIGSEQYICDSYIKTSGKLIHAIKRKKTSTGDQPNMLDIICDAINQRGDYWSSFERDASSVVFLLDNISDDYKTSRFAIDREVRRHPIDVLLMLLTTMPNEFVIGDAQASSTSTTIIFPASALGSVPNYWDGYALHCVEGTNKGQVRKIASSTTGSANQVVVERAFSGAPAAGDEYQIRNSIYDVLPIGWGMGIENWRIDIESFEDVRDQNLGGAKLGTFMIGAAKVDLLKLIQEDICQPYCIMLYTNRTTGLLSCRYMGDALGDGVIDDYVAVSQSGILETGDISYGIDKPIGSVSLSVRSLRESVVGTHYEAGEYFGVNEVIDTTLTQSFSIDGEMATLIHTSPELSAAYAEHFMEKLEITARLNSVDDCEYVAGLCVARLRKYTTPPPTIGLRLSMEFIETVQAGDVLAITHESVVDPFTGAIGLASVAGRVIDSSIVLENKNPGVRVVVELLGDIIGAKISPAAIVTAKGSDANGQYLEAKLTEFVVDEDNDRDHRYFAVGDLVELRDATGALKEDLGAITGFGTNFTSDPDDATESGSRCRIYVSDAAIAATIAADDHIAFKPWSASNTIRMDNYSAFATAAGALTGGDAPKEYG